MRTPGSAQGDIPNIPAQTWSDDHAVKVDFDAGAYFANVYAREGADGLLKLCRILEGEGWGYCIEADAIARYFEERDKDIERLFWYLDQRLHVREPPGFEVRVEEAAVRAYLAHLDLLAAFDEE